MIVSWKSWTKLLLTCLLLYTTGVQSQTFRLQPLNLTVLQGSNVSFNATVFGNWKVMTWQVRGFLVLTVQNNVTSSSPQFSAAFCSAGDTSCVVFTIHNVSRREAGPVVCTVQGEYGSQTAQLNVEESGTVGILGKDVTAEQDQEVEFQCVARAWFPAPTVTWTRNGHSVNSSLYNTVTMEDGGHFNSTSVLKFRAVGNSTVECRATVPTLATPRSSSVYLVVVPKPTDWTVLIAVVVSFGGFALLVLLIIGIIFCYKRRKEKESTYQDEMRRVRTQSQVSSVSAAVLRRGRVNEGFVPGGQTSIAPSELTDSGLGQESGASGSQVPDVVYSNQTGNGYNIPYLTIDEPGFRKHRHLTIV